MSLVTIFYAVLIFVWVSLAYLVAYGIVWAYRVLTRKPSFPRTTRYVFDGHHPDRDGMEN